MDAPSVVAAADRLLERARGWHVRTDCEPVQLEGSRRCLVQRVAVEGADAPPTVIVKAHGESFETFINEAAAAEFLSSSRDLAGFGPHLSAVDSDVPLVVLEDMGAHPSVADALLGSDPDQAAAFLVQWAGTLGQLHSATLGAREAFDARRQRLAGEREVAFGDEEPAAELARGVKAICDLGVERPPGLESGR